MVNYMEIICKVYSNSYLTTILKHKRLPPPQPSTLNPQPSTLNSQLSILNSQFSTAPSTLLVFSFYFLVFTESVLQHRQFLGGESGRGVDDHDVVAIGQRTHVEDGAQSLVDVRQPKTALQVVDLHTAEPIG